MKHLLSFGVMGLGIITVTSYAWCQAQSTKCAAIAASLDPPLQGIPVLKTASRPDKQDVCAQRLVQRLAQRDGFADFISDQVVQLDARNRITVHLQFKRDMRKVFKELGTFWKFPKWLGGRYASSFGRGQPGFEIHLDQNNPSATLVLRGHESSDIDDHEPAGDLESIVLHFVDLTQHKMGNKERLPCDLLARLPADQLYPGSEATDPGLNERSE